MDINKLIEDHGLEIASQLRIASEQVYEKVLWYIQIKGMLNLAQMVLIALWIPIALWIVRKYYNAAKNDFFKDEYDSTGLYMSTVVVGFVTLLLGSVIWGEIISSLVNNASMIVSPEYYLINQIVENIGE